MVKLYQPNGQTSRCNRKKYPHTTKYKYTPRRIFWLSEIQAKTYLGIYTFDKEDLITQRLHTENHAK